MDPFLWHLQSFWRPALISKDGGELAPAGGGREVNVLTVSGGTEGVFNHQSNRLLWNDPLVLERLQ